MSKYSEENISRIGNAAIYIAEHTSDLSKTKLLYQIHTDKYNFYVDDEFPFIGRTSKS